jgi:hypothetical protein
MDPVHRLLRKAYELKMKSPIEQRKAAIARKKYVRKNKSMLARKAKIARQFRKHSTSKR